MSSYKYALSPGFTTGVGTITYSITNVVGTGTTWLTELAVGDLIRVNGQDRFIANIADDTHLTVTEAFDDADTDVAFTNLIYQLLDVHLFVPPPRGIYIPYTQPLLLGNGLVRAGGWKAAEWRWGYLTQAQRNALRGWCPGSSSEVWFRTRVYDDSDAYRTFFGVMVWPVEEDRQATRRLSFTIRFQAMQQKVDAGAEP